MILPKLCCQWLAVKGGIVYKSFETTIREVCEEVLLANTLHIREDASVADRNSIKRYELGG